MMEKKWLSKFLDALPEEIVDAAKHRESPIHDAFEWDDSVAATEYRKEQARELLRAVAFFRLNMQARTFKIRGTSPYVANKFPYAKFQGDHQ